MTSLVKFPLDRGLIRYATSTAVAAIVAIAAFAGVAGVFGGGWQGYLVASVVFVLVLVVAYFAQAAQPRKRPGSLSEPESPATAQRSKGSISSGVRGLKPRDPGPVCDPGPYSIEGGGMTWIELDAKKGERVRGHLTETSGQDFDWAVVDENGLVEAQRGEDCFVMAGNEDVTADTVRWTPRSDGPWYLIIDLPRRSNPREVLVELRRVR